MRPQVYRALEKCLAQWEASHCVPMPEEERRFIQHEVNVGYLILPIMNAFFICPGSSAGATGTGRTI